MQQTAILIILSLAAFALANPVANPDVFGVERSSEAQSLVGTSPPSSPPPSTNPSSLDGQTQPN